MFEDFQKTIATDQKISDEKRANVGLAALAFCEEQQEKRERLNDDSITGLTRPLRTARLSVT